MRQDLQILLSHETTEWYTPERYINLAKLAMNGIDLDPASNSTAQKWIRAKTYYTIQNNGLNSPWFGRVFLNPPYSKTNGKSNQEIWAKKLIVEYQAGRVSEAIMLAKSALGYKWFEEVWDKSVAVCLARDLINFIKPDGSTNGPAKLGSTFFYWGPNSQRFKFYFDEIGRVIYEAKTK